MGRKVKLLLERADTVVTKVNSALGMVRNEDDGENSFACLEEANNNNLLMQSVNRSLDRLVSQPIVNRLVDLSIPSTIELPGTSLPDCIY